MHLGAVAALESRLLHREVGTSGSVPEAEINVVLSRGLIALETREESLGSYFFSTEIKP
jgi:hypothetical protein